jgi:hypothetical protein
VPYDDENEKGKSMKHFLFLLLLPFTVFAHHGKEFLVTSTYKTPDKGKFFFLLSSDYIQASHSGEGFEFEPAGLYGITNKLSAEIHTHYGLFNKKFSFESIGFETRYRFFGSGEIKNKSEDHQHNNSFPFSLAGLIEFEKGIGEHHNTLEGRLIFGKDIHNFSLVLNIIGSKIFGENGKFNTQYAIGMKYDFTSNFSMGVEFEGDTFRPQITPGIYSSLFSNLDFRVGASFPTDSHSGEFLVRGVLIYPF